MNTSISNGVKILYIITQADGGGAQKYVLGLAKNFGGSIAAGNEAEQLFKDASDLKLTTYRLQHLKRNISPLNDVLTIWEIRQLVKTLNPDIVHLNSSKAGFLGSLACMFLKTKVIFTAHGFIFNEPMSLWKKNFYIALEKIASDYRDFIITVSDADKQSALKYKLIDEKKIQTIHNGIGQINFLSKDEAREALGLPKDKKIFGTIANDYKTKGLDTLVNLQPIQGAIIGVIGNAPNRVSNENIKFLGLKDNASKFLKAFDGILIPSKKEGFPFVALEAMQAGLPIIASNVGGMPEALGDAGELVIPDDPKTLRERIETNFMDEKRSAEMSRRSLERSKLFTEDKMLKATEEIYKRLLS